MPLQKALLLLMPSLQAAEPFVNPSVSPVLVVCCHLNRLVQTEQNEFVLVFYSSEKV